MRLVADIEANGLYEEVTRIHCIVCKDIDTKIVYKYFEGEIGIDKDGDLADGVRILTEAEMVIGHNIIDYDARVLQKFYDVEPDVTKITDTYIRSLMDDPHRLKHKKCPVSKVYDGVRRPIGAHSLENWGYVVGRGKVEHEDWTKLTPAMVHRCVEDVEITELVHNHIEKNWKGWDWSTAEWIEKRFRLIMSEQEGYGWLFDKEGAKHCIGDLTGKIADIDVEVLPRIPLLISSDEKTITTVRKKDGGYNAHFIKWYEKGDGQIPMSAFCYPHTRVEFVQINLASNGQVKEYLLSVGWNPTEWNYKKDGKRFAKDAKGRNIKTSPKLTEDSFDSLKDDTGKLISKRVQYCHRRSQIQGWIENVREDGRIGAGGNSVGTNTGRVTHRDVVNVPKAEDGVYYGKEMRSLFTTPEGKVLCGSDLCALEDRIAGHFTHRYDKGAYATLLLSGDPHSKTAAMFKTERYLGKRCNHALKYGAQGAKLAEILDIDVGKAYMYWDQWWSKHPSLKALKDKIEHKLEKRGQIKDGKLMHNAWVQGIDGRKIYVRSKHSLLNALIQNAGSVVNKLTTIYIDDLCNERWIDAHFVGNFHDEAQAEVAEEDAEEYMELPAIAADMVNDFFEFKVPMATDVKAGNNWAETH